MGASCCEIENAVSEFGHKIDYVIKLLEYVARVCMENKEKSNLKCPVNVFHDGTSTESRNDVNVVNGDCGIEQNCLSSSPDSSDLADNDKPIAVGCSPVTIRNDLALTILNNKQHNSIAKALCNNKDKPLNLSGGNAVNTSTDNSSSSMLSSYLSGFSKPKSKRKASFPKARTAVFSNENHLTAGFHSFSPQSVSPLSIHNSMVEGIDDSASPNSNPIYIAEPVSLASNSTANTGKLSALCDLTANVDRYDEDSDDVSVSCAPISMCGSVGDRFVYIPPSSASSSGAIASTTTPLILADQADQIISDDEMLTEDDSFCGGGGQMSSNDESVPSPSGQMAGNGMMMELPVCSSDNGDVDDDDADCYSKKNNFVIKMQHQMLKKRNPALRNRTSANKFRKRARYTKHSPITDTPVVEVCRQVLLFPGRLLGVQQLLRYGRLQTMYRNHQVSCQQLQEALCQLRESGLLFESGLCKRKTAFSGRIAKQKLDAKRAPEEVTEEMLEPYGVSLAHYVQAYERPPCKELTEVIECSTSSPASFSAFHHLHQSDSCVLHDDSPYALSLPVATEQDPFGCQLKKPVVGMG